MDLAGIHYYQMMIEFWKRKINVSFNNNHCYPMLITTSIHERPYCNIVYFLMLLWSCSLGPTIGVLFKMHVMINVTYGGNSASTWMFWPYTRNKYNYHWQFSLPDTMLLYYCNGFAISPLKHIPVDCCCLRLFQKWQIFFSLGDGLHHIKLSAMTIISSQGEV